MKAPNTACVVAAETVGDLRFQRRVERIHALGVRPVAELLAAIAAERGIRTLIDRKLDVFAELSPDAVEAVEGTGFWPAPIRMVER